MTKRWSEQEAVEAMLKSGLEPLEPYKSNASPWKCKCNKCEIIFEKELYESEWKKLNRNQDGRVYCSIKCAKSHSSTKNEETINKIKVS